MLRIDRKPQFWTDVNPPALDQGDRSFRAQFRVIGAKEMAGFNLDTPEGTNQFLEAALAGIEDVVGPDGLARTLSFVLPALLDDPTIRIALVRAYYEGLAKAREGN